LWCALRRRTVTGIRRPLPLHVLVATVQQQWPADSVGRPL